MLSFSVGSTTFMYVQISVSSLLLINLFAEKNKDSIIAKFYRSLQPASRILANNKQAIYSTINNACN